MRSRPGTWTYVRNAILFQVVAVPIGILVSLLPSPRIFLGESPLPLTPFGVFLAGTVKMNMIYGLTGGLVLSLTHTWLLPRFWSGARATTIRRSLLSAGALAVVQAIPLLSFVFAPALVSSPFGALAYGWVVGRLWAREVQAEEVQVAVLEKIRVKAYVRNAFLFQLVGIPTCIVAFPILRALTVLTGIGISDSTHYPLVAAWPPDPEILGYCAAYGFTGGLGLSLFHRWIMSRVRFPSRAATIRNSLLCAGALAALQVSPSFMQGLDPILLFVPAALVYGWLVGRLRAKETQSEQTAASSPPG